MPATPEQKVGRTIGAVAASTATAALACGVCCVLPVALPALALSGFGASLAWIDRAHSVLTWIAMAAVAGGWAWVGVQASRSKARTASRTLLWMASATVALGLALAWPYLEPLVIAAISRQQSAG